jgi:hypothetical protein
MKKSALILGILMYSINLIGQENWELPMKNDIVYYQINSSQFKNTTKKLKGYFISGPNPMISQYITEVNNKIRSELSKKGGKYFSTTDYMMYLGYDFLKASDYGKISDKNFINLLSDTLDGSITITTVTQNNHIIHLFGDKSSNFSLTAKVRIIFTKNTYEMKIRGFTVKDLSVNFMKGSVQTNEAALEDSYNNFLKDKKKDKAEMKFYTELNELIHSLVIIMNERFEKDIKVDQLD